MNDQPSRDPIEILAEEFVQRYREGERPTIDQFAREHAEYADDIRNLFPMIVNIESLKQETAASGLTATLAVTGIERLGDFRIIREIGRGGMGIVYEAEQQSLGRHVALKVIGANVASSAHGVLRFRREAEAAARLHHTNIVPIYGVGEENGIYFYAMQMIDGVGLDTVLDALRNGSLPTTRGENSAATPGIGVGSSTAAAALEVAAVLRDGSISQSKRPTRVDAEATAVAATLEYPITRPEACGNHPPARPKVGGRYWKSVARLGAAAAGALEYAHRHGVLHRDVKPSNLLLDREANLWIADFGLAKHSDSDNLTKTGDVVGTLRYMAPEQFEGKSDHRSDIYSLGLTLHELLTFQPAFDEAEQGPLVRQKMHGAPPRPRSRNPAIPRDLETIVLKACATVPADRYRSAGELADDLQRFLDERPVAARRVGFAEQLWRWCRRNPAIAGSTAVTLALLITTAVVAVVSNIAIRAALTTAQDARSDALKSQKLAEGNLSLAIDAFESIFDNVANRGIPQSLQLEYEDESAPKFESILSDADADLLRELLTFWERFARQNSPDAQLQARTAAAYHRIGQIHQRLGHIDDAAESYAESLAIYDRLLAEQPDHVDQIIAKAQLLNDRGGLASEPMKRSRRMADDHLQAIAFLSDQPGTIAAAPPVRYELARSHDLAGSAFFRDLMSGLLLDSPPGPPGMRGRGPGSGHDGPPPEMWNEPGIGPPHDFGPPPKMDEGMGPPHDIGPPGGINPKEFTEQHLSQAYEIISELLKDDPRNPQYRLLLAQVQRHRLVHLSLGGRTAEAKEPFDAAKTILTALVAEYPQKPQYRLELADTLSLAGERLSSLSEAEARDYLHEAIESCQQLARAFPNAPEYQALLAKSYQILANVEQASHDLKGAEENLDLARKGLESLVERSPDKAFHEARLIGVLWELARLKRARGAQEHDTNLIAESRELLDDAIQRFSASTDREEDPFRRRVQSSLYESLSETLSLLGDEAGAAAAREKVEQLGDTPFHHPFGRFRPEFGPPGNSDLPPPRTEPVERP